MACKARRTDDLALLHRSDPERIVAVVISGNIFARERLIVRRRRPIGILGDDPRIHAEGAGIQVCIVLRRHPLPDLTPALRLLDRSVYAIAFLGNVGRREHQRGAVAERHFAKPKRHRRRGLLRLRHSSVAFS